MTVDVHGGRGTEGSRARYEPEEVQETTLALCVHHIERSPKRPERLFMQFHGGVYRSDDAGESWVEIGEGLVSDFGFPLAVDPDDPDCAFVIPLQADVDRVTPEGRVRVFETRDGGATWTSRVSGLPQRHAYLTVLRLAFDQAKSDSRAGAVLRCHLGRGVRVPRRRRELGQRRRAAPAGLLA